MKIIVSPSKTQNYKQKHIELHGTSPFFLDETNMFFDKVTQLSLSEIEAFYKISAKQAQKVYDGYTNYGSVCNTAINAFTGLVFKYMSIDQWTDDMVCKSQDLIVILDAMYGALQPSDIIHPYRLDMSHSKILADQSLANFWSERLADYFADDDIILNLASNEFADNCPQDKLIHFDFIDIKDDNEIRLNTYVKMARGKMINSILSLENITLDQISQINVHGFCYSKQHSTERLMTFIRTEEERELFLLSLK